MKKLLSFSLFALVAVLFTPTDVDAQVSYRKVLIQFDKVKNEAGIPGKSALYLDKQIQRSLMELNRMEVVPFVAPSTDEVSRKPKYEKTAKVIEKPAEEKPAPTPKANVTAQVSIISFTTRNAGNKITAPNAAEKGPNGEHSFMVEGKKVFLRGQVDFKDIASGKIVESREFKGKYLALPIEGKSLSQATMLKKVMDIAIKNFREDVKYLFQGDFVIKEVLEGKKGQVLNVVISGGSSKDIKSGYEYVAYTRKSIGKGKVKKDPIGTLVILNVKENSAMAKVEEGKNNIYRMMKGEGGGRVFVELK